MSVSMVSWDETYSNHTVWEITESTIEALDDIDIDDPDLSDKLNRIRATLQVVLDWQDTPSLLVSETMLANLDSAVRNNIKRELDNWKSNRDPGHVQNAYNNLGSVLEQTRGWPQTKDRYAKGLITTIQEVGRESESTLGSLREEIEVVKEDLQNQLEAVSKNIEGREATANESLQSLTNQVSQSKQTLDQLLAKATELDKRVDTVMTTQQNTFTTTEAQRQRAHSDNIEEQKGEFEQAIDKAVEESNSSLEGQETTGNEILGRLEQLETQAKNLVEATAEASTTTDYGRYAENEKKTADRLRLTAVLIIILGGLTVVGILIYEGYDGSTGQTWLVKSALSLPFVAAAWYLVRESSRHRDEAELAKDTQLKILALGPFITNMEDDDQRELRKAAATELFVNDRRTAIRNKNNDK